MGGKTPCEVEIGLWHSEGGLSMERKLPSINVTDTLFNTTLTITTILSPGSKLRKPPRSNFQCLSQLIHHGVIAVPLLSGLWAADAPQLKASTGTPYLWHWPGRLLASRH
ncbi:hypothetical protein NQZ68_012237 [Dissostichus eleginoides]|nr:hypothetical protein NQZ68_012237 [Dissostichus eleginoides]